MHAPKGYPVAPFPCPGNSRALHCCPFGRIPIAWPHGTAAWGVSPPGETILGAIVPSRLNLAMGDENLAMGDEAWEPYFEPHHEMMKHGEMKDLRDEAWKDDAFS